MPSGPTGDNRGEPPGPSSAPPATSAAGAAPSPAVDLNGLRLPTPALVASGCFGPELGQLSDIRKLGGIVTRTITLEPTRGAATPRVAETPSGILSDTGLQNEGIDTFLTGELPALARLGVPVVVSVGGFTAPDYMHLTMALDGQEAVAAIEVNACCPSRERGGRWFALTPEGAAEVVGAVARLTRRPVFGKLTPRVANLVEVAEACIRAGAHGLTLIHPPQGMAIDVEHFRARLAAGYGALSGPALRPVAIWAVHEVSRAFPDVPILGVGGVVTASDALEFLMAGAWAVQVGSAVFSDPSAPVDVARGIVRFLRDRGLSSVADLRLVMQGIPREPERDGG